MHLRFVPHGPSLSPFRRHIDQVERLAALSARSASIVAHEVNLDETRLAPVPVRERLYGDLALEKHARLRSGTARERERGPLCGKQAVDRGR